MHTACENTRQWVFSLFSDCAQQHCKKKEKETGPLRSPSSVPTASTSASILSGKPNSKSGVLFMHELQHLYEEALTISNICNANNLEWNK